MVPPESKNAAADAAAKTEDYSIMGAIAALSPWAEVRERGRVSGQGSGDRPLPSGTPRNESPGVPLLTRRLPRRRPARRSRKSFPAQTQNQKMRSSSSSSRPAAWTAKPCWRAWRRLRPRRLTR